MRTLARHLRINLRKNWCEIWRKNWGEQRAICPISSASFFLVSSASILNPFPDQAAPHLSILCSYVGFVFDLSLNWIDLGST